MATANELKYEQLKRDRADALKAVKNAAIDAERDHYQTKVVHLELQMGTTWAAIEEERAGVTR